MRPADLLRGGDPLVGVGRGHLDVDDGDVRALELDAAQEARSVLGFPHHVEAGVGEEAGEPLPQEHGIVGDDYPHGISARILTPPPGARSTARRPSRAPTRSSSSTSPAGSAFASTSTTSAPSRLAALTRAAPAFAASATTR